MRSLAETERRMDRRLERKQAKIVRSLMGRVLEYLYQEAQGAEDEVERDAFRLALCIVGNTRRDLPCTIELAVAYTFGRSLAKHIAVREAAKALREKEFVDANVESPSGARRPEPFTGNVYKMPIPEVAPFQEPLRGLPAQAKAAG